MNELDLNQYLDVLKANKAKITPQRVEILKLFLANTTHHYTAEEIIESIGESNLGQGTVYRTLELFSKLGIVKKVNFNNEEFVQYDLVDLNKEHFHHHLICRKCNDVLEITDDLLVYYEDVILSNYGFKVDNHELVFRGLCKRCLGDNDEN